MTSAKYPGVGVYPGDRLPKVPDATWNRMSRVRPMDGPRCYLCNRLFRQGDAMVLVALGPGQQRSHFRKPDPQDSGDCVYVGAECARRYVPPESVMSEKKR